MFFHKLANTLDSKFAFGYSHGHQMPYVHHLIPDFERDINASGTPCLVQTQGIVEQNLVPADLYQQGRQPGKVGKRIRVYRIRPAACACPPGRT